MERNKPPALTSPGRIGLLIALLLVVTALGVSFFITRTFGVPWTWIRSTPSWSLRLESFFAEMVPLVVLVALLAFASYVLITGAVRRYKTYVDSGLDYKNLLRSIKDLEDLEDDDRIEHLKEHPEMRDFLMAVKRGVMAREQALSERERKLAAHRPTEAPAGPNPREIAARLEMDALRADVEKTLATVRGAVAGILDDVDACINGAREIEGLLARTREAADGVGTPTSWSGGLSTALGRMDAMADALESLGEDAKRVAIAAAMKASGTEGPGEETIRVADEVRAIAVRFGTVARTWRELGPALRAEAERVGAGAAQAQEGRAALVEAAHAAASRASLWSERIVALSRHVRALERAAAPAGGSSEQPFTRARTEERTVPTEAPAAPRAAYPTSAAEVEITRQERGSVFAATEEERFADVPGLEKERRVFTEPEGEAQRETVGASAGPDGRFAIDRADMNTWSFAGIAGEATERAPSGEKTAADEGFLTGPMPSGPAEPEPAVAPAAAGDAVAEDPDADAVNLYELGAVDYFAQEAYPRG